MRVAYSTRRSAETIRTGRVLSRVSLIGITIQCCRMPNRLTWALLFASRSTSGMTTASKRKPAFDPARQWGLKPEPDRDAASATYVMSGHIVSGGPEAKGIFVSENIGRDAQAKAARKSSAKDADLALQKLLKRDKEGTKAVAAAREHGKKLAEQARGKHASARGKSKGKQDGAGEKKREPLTDDGNNEFMDPGKGVYSVNLVRTLGFDPTGKDGRKVVNKEVQKKVR